MIDEQRTFKLFKYTSNTLKPRARKKIIRICDECGKEDIIGFGDYNRLKYPNLCRSCNRKNVLKLPKPKFVSESERFLNGTQIDRILTIEKFGYDPIDLKEKSIRKVVVICQNCDKIRDNLFCNYRNLCGSCAALNKITLTCKQCGKKFEVIPFYKNQQFCSCKCSKIGKNNPMFGMNGKLNPMFGVHRLGKAAPNWKGGIAGNRDHIKHECNCIKINSKIKSFEGHHIMSGVIIYIPKYIHRSIYHNMKNGQGIIEMNTLAWKFLMDGI